MNIVAKPRILLVAAMLAACLPAPAPAQDSSTYLHRLRGAEIPLSEAQFVLYQYVAGAPGITPDERLQAEVRAELDIGNARFYALLDHMGEVIAASDEFAEAQNRRMCAGREELDTVEALGAALDASTEAVRAYQAELMDEVRPILGEAGQPRFLALLADLRLRMVVSRVDYTALLTAQEIEPAVALQDICRKAAEAAETQEEEPGQG